MNYQNFVEKFHQKMREAKARDEMNNKKRFDYLDDDDEEENTEDNNQALNPKINVPQTFKKKNVTKVLEHYCANDSDNDLPASELMHAENNSNDQKNDYLNVESLNPKKENQVDTINELSSFPESEGVLTSGNYLNSIRQLKPKKFQTVAKENIEAAVQENAAKKQYTAYTYSTIQKKKNTEKPKKSKSIKFIFIVRT